MSASAGKAAKDGAGSKASKAAKSKDPPAPQSVYAEFGAQEVALLKSMESAEDFIWMDLKLVDWLHADLTVCVRASVPLWTIRRHIRDRHTHVERLQIFRAPAHKKNEILDFSLTLQQLGFVGGPREAGLRGVLYYNFKPGRIRDPVLFREPQLLLERSAQREREAREVLEDMGIVAPQRAEGEEDSAGDSAGAGAGAGGFFGGGGFSALGGLK